MPGGTSSATNRSGGFKSHRTIPDKAKMGDFLWYYFGFLYFNIEAKFDLIFQQDNFTTVPINSSLDLQNVSAATFNQSYIYPINGLAGSRSVTYIANESFTASINGNNTTLYNYEHADFTKRQSQWMFNEMENRDNSVINCEDAQSCSSTVFSISSNGDLCTHRTYFLSPSAPGTTIIWSVYPNDGTVTLTPNAASVDIDLSAATPGTNYTLTASITGNCNLGSVSTQLSVPVSTWSGSILGMTGWWNTIYIGPLVQGENYLYTGSGANYFEIWNEGINEQTIGYWEFVSGVRASYTGPHFIGFDLWWLSGVDANYNYNFTDHCGSHSIPYHFMSTNENPPAYRMAQPAENYQLKLSPNPATNFVNISVVEVDGNKKADSKIFDYNTQKMIRVFDKFGNLIIQRNEIIPKAGLKLNVSILKYSDIYHIIVDDGNGLRLSGRLIKQ